MGLEIYDSLGHIKKKRKKKKKENKTEKREKRAEWWGSEMCT